MMPILRRNGTASLLRVVRGKPHATDNDHEDQTGSAEQRGPQRVKSKDERALRTSSRASNSLQALKSLSRDQASVDQNAAASRKINAQSRHLQQSENTASMPPASSGSNKAPHSSAASLFADDMSSNRSRKRPLAKYGSQKTSNIHKPRVIVPRKKQKTSVSQANGSSASQAESEKTASKFAKLMGDSPDRSIPTPKASAVSSKLAALANSYQEDDATSEGSATKRTGSPTYLGAAPGTEVDASRELSPLSLSPLTPVSESDEPFTQMLDLTGQDTSADLQCPICARPFDSASWKSYKDRFPDLDISLQEQRRFHRAHRVEDAQLAYRIRKYPSIDWDDLSRRLSQHNADVCSMIQRPADTFCYQRFKRKLEDDTQEIDGERRHQFWRDHDQTIKLAGTGYYGPRGANIMTEHLSSSFATLLSTVAKTDKLICECGLSVYIQLILVPELATMLIGKDMNINLEEARKVLIESSEIGNLVHGKNTQERGVKESIVEIDDDSSVVLSDEDNVTEDDEQDDLEEAQDSGLDE